MKAWLSEHQVDYEERDIAVSEEALSELEAIGVLTTPVFTVGDHVIVGFDRAKLEQLLVSGELGRRN